jgi:Raf kinase inhibitor-like YbhB/YbcL family protein
MKKYLSVFLVLFLLAFIFIALLRRHLKSSQINSPNSVMLKSSMELTSNSFENNSTIPKDFTCDGQNINPDLQITQIPENTKSLALIMDDPDAPAGNWTHWLLANIEPNTTHIEKNQTPKNVVVGKNSFGDTKYGGPCPPNGAHHYQFKLYALDTNLDLKQGFSKNELLKSMQGHIIDQSLLIGLYR